VVRKTEKAIFSTGIGKLKKNSNFPSNNVLEKTMTKLIRERMEREVNRVNKTKRRSIGDNCSYPLINSINNLPKIKESTKISPRMMRKTIATEN
jgi:RNase P subunit RPR2